MKGKDVRIIIEKLQEYNIGLDTLNKILMLDERLISKINLAKDKQDLNNIIKIILTRYPSVDDTIDALNIYLNCSNPKIQSIVIEILMNEILIQDNYHIELAKEYIDKPSKYVKRFISN